MAATSPPLEVGVVSTDSMLDADLGKKWTVAGVEYVLVKSTGSFTGANGSFVEYADPTVGTATVSGLADAAEVVANVAGAMPSGLDSLSIVSGDYFLLARRGYAIVMPEANFAAGAALAVHGSDGKLDDATVAENTTVARAFGAGTTDTAVVALLCLP